MDRLTKDTLNTLIEMQGDTLVSIYLPTHRRGRETQQDSIRLKNLLTEAKEQLVDAGMPISEAGAMLEPAQQLLPDEYFWQHQSDGLALFIGPSFFRTFRLPLEFNTFVSVANRFHIKPLLPLFSVNGTYFVLALSQNLVRLFAGNRFGLGEIELKDVPQGLAEAMRFMEQPPSQQHHTKTAETGSGRAAVFHGQGAGKDRENSRLVEYFRQVDKGLHKVLKTKNAPLILAGVEYLFPHYYEANTYPHLLEEGITGNPDQLHPDTLHDQAWQIVEPLFKESQQETLEAFHAISQTERASQDIREILPAAYSGKVDTLFVSLEHHQWGQFDLHTNTLNLTQNATPENKDLLDAAAIQTLLHNGTVYAMKPDNIPEEAPMAAIFRYA